MEEVAAKVPYLNPNPKPNPSSNPSSDPSPTPSFYPAPRCRLHIPNPHRKPKPNLTRTLTKVPAEATHRSDTFRRAQLYTVPVHDVWLKHEASPRA